MANLIDQIMRGHTYKKDVYLELTAENEVARMAVTDQGGIARGDLQNFVDKCIREAMKQPAVPDNMILHYENIPPDEIPATAYFFSRGEELLHRFILQNGINEYNTIPLRKAAFLDFHGEKITADLLKEIENRTSYRQYVAHEDAIERIQTGRIAKVVVTCAETNLGIVVFSDSLRGSKAQRDYLQHMADSFFSKENEGLEFLQLYRFETTSGPLIAQADTCCQVDELGRTKYNFTPEVNAQISLLNCRTPIIGYDMRPTCRNLDTFLCSAGVEISARNSNILLLDSIVRDGYSGIHSGNFSYQKEFHPVETGLHKLRHESMGLSICLHRERYEEIQNQARQIACRILQQDIQPRAELTPAQMLKRLHPRTVSVRKGDTQDAPSKQEKAKKRRLKR